MLFVKGNYIGRTFATLVEIAKTESRCDTIKILPCSKVVSDEQRHKYRNGNGEVTI